MWRDIVRRVLRDRQGFTVDEMTRAGAWATCYVGECDAVRVAAGLPSLMRVNVYGDNFGPADASLNLRGVDFKMYVRLNDPQGAARVMAAIDDLLRCVTP